MDLFWNKMNIHKKWDKEHESGFKNMSHISATLDPITTNEGVRNKGGNGGALGMLAK